MGEGGWEVVERLVELSANDGELQERGREVVERLVKCNTSKTSLRSDGGRWSISWLKMRDEMLRWVRLGGRQSRGSLIPLKCLMMREVRLGGRNWCKGIFGLVSKVRWVIEDSFFNDGVCEKLIVILVRAGGGLVTPSIS